MRKMKIHTKTKGIAVALRNLALWFLDPCISCVGELWKRMGCSARHRRLLELAKEVQAMSQAGVGTWS